MKMKVAIIGATGYGGAELVRILHNHPQAEIVSVHATRFIDQELSKSFPHMKDIFKGKLEAVDIEKIGQTADLVFTATPTGVAKDLAKKLMAQNVHLIDLSGDFRIKDQSIYKDWYQAEPADQALLDQAVYGLAEWVDLTKESKLIANPGCFPTSALLGLAPLVKNKLIKEDSIIIDAKTGVSGAGRGLSQANHYSETNENTKAYKVNAHQHTPEIEQELKKWNEKIDAITFTPHLVPMTRGILSTIYVTANQELTEAQVQELFEESYVNNYFVRVKDKGEQVATKEVSGSNFCDLSVTYDKRTKRITVVSVIDNLVKGASGQAVQNMNKLFGLDENTGLNLMPVFP